MSYGNFSAKQIMAQADRMHNEIHRLLIYKEHPVKNPCFADETEFLSHFRALISKYLSFNKLLGEPTGMIPLLCSLEEAYNEALKSDFDFKLFRKHILDAHGTLTVMFGEVRDTCQQ